MLVRFRQKHDTKFVLDLNAKFLTFVTSLSTYSVILPSTKGLASTALSTVTLEKPIFGAVGVYIIIVVSGVVSKVSRGVALTVTFDKPSNPCEGSTSKAAVDGVASFVSRVGAFPSLFYLRFKA